MVSLAIWDGGHLGQVGFLDDREAVMIVLRY